MAEDDFYEMRSRAVDREYASGPSPDAAQIEEAQLYHDANFIAASKDVYYLYEGKEFTGTNDDAVRYGISAIGDFEYNFAGPMGTVDQAARIVSGASPDAARSFLYMMDQYEKLPNFTAAGTWRMLRGIVSDPINYAGVATLGIGSLLGKAGAKTASVGIKKALVELAKRPVKSAAASGAIVGGATDVARQQIETEAGQEIAPEEALLRTGLSAITTAAMAGGLVKGAQVAASGAKSIGKKIVGEPETPQAPTDLTTTPADGNMQDGN